MATSKPAIRVAAGQMVAQDLAHADSAFDVMERLVGKAREAGAALLVLPECAYPAYWLGSSEQYRTSNVLRTPKVLERLSQLAAQNRLHVVCGLVEETGDNLYNSAAVFDAAGELIGIARKTFLWDCDNRWFSPGDCISVFDTVLGRIGVQICADARAPETTATLVAKGAELIAMPTAWVAAKKGLDPNSEIQVARRRTRGEPIDPTSTQAPQEFVLHNIQPEFLIESRAREFHVPFICADKAGHELPLAYVGQSMIVTAGGQILQRGPKEGEALVVDEVTPAPGKAAVVTPEQRKRLISARNAIPPQLGELPPRNDLLLQAASFGFESGNARAATIDGHDANSFVAARCLAMEGVQVLCVRDAPHDLATLRTRAAENRIFVLAESHRMTAIIHPTGHVLAHELYGKRAFVCANVNDADVKQFTPETDLWEQRRTECYEFGSTEAM